LRHRAELSQLTGGRGRSEFAGHASIGVEGDNLTKRASGRAVFGLPEMLDLKQVALF
jgi:hypothetical protein